MADAGFIVLGAGVLVIVGALAWSMRARPRARARRFRETSGSTDTTASPMIFGDASGLHGHHTHNAAGNDNSEFFQGGHSGGGGASGSWDGPDSGATDSGSGGDAGGGDAGGGDSGGGDSGGGGDGGGSSD